MKSMRSLLTIAAALATIVTGASAAAASPGFVTNSLNLRSGPSTGYPAVVVMQAGDPVEIYGCLYGWSWCDINWNGFRGWAAGQYLQVYYAQARRPIVSYGAYFSIPTLSFSIGTYWNQHYRNRSFFTQMSKFGGPPQQFQYGGPPPQFRYQGPPPYQAYQGPPPQYQYQPPPPQWQYKQYQQPPYWKQPKQVNPYECSGGQFKKDGICTEASGS